jgi:hypothetical protein
MTIVRTFVSLWLCLVFLSSGLQGFVLCVDTHHGGIDVNLELDGGSHKASMGNDAGQQDDDGHNLFLSNENCCYDCLDIPLFGQIIPDFTSRQAKGTKISEAQVLAAFQEPCLLAGQAAASSLASLGPAMGSMSHLERTVVLRI